MKDLTVDVLVVGGGINGAGVAADAAGRGLSVCLCEQDDLASYTSSWSTKLIHGGLRYLEQYDFRLVRESLRERKILRERAPHLVRPIPFYLPHSPGGRPAWFIRLGLWLYDHLASHGDIPGSSSFVLAAEEDNPLQKQFKRCFSYFDCQVDDSRLVLLNAKLAQSKGATIKTRCEVVSAQCEGGQWVVQVHDKQKGEVEVIRAGAIVNATGPWVDLFGQQLLGQAMSQQVRCVKGSHFIVKSFYTGNQAYMLQQADGRIVFCIPYLDKYCLVGTTDVEFKGDLQHPEMSDEESDYLLNALNQSFSKQHSTSDILGSFAGVRPLYDDHTGVASKVSREYHLQCDVIDDKLPIIHVVGGKLTTYRHVAEEVVNRLQPFFPEVGSGWTKTAVFPGSDWGDKDEQRCRQDFFSHYSGLNQGLLTRLWKSHGMSAYAVLGDAKEPSDLGVEILPGLHAKEVAHYTENEWVVTASDLLWRRTKLGLEYNEEQHELLDTFFRGLHLNTLEGG
jgi:glycerol-3-phosphate dehydrogenase